MKFDVDKLGAQAESVATHTQAETLGLIDAAKQKLIGSGDMSAELGGLKDNYKDFWVNTALNVPTPLPAMLKLVTGHPIEAVQAAAKGYGTILNSLADIATAPTRLGYASAVGAKNVAVAGYDGLWDGAEALFNAPVTVPLAMYEKGSEWTGRFADFVHRPIDWVAA